MVCERKVAALLTSHKESSLVTARMKVNSLINHVVGKRKLSEDDINRFKQDIIESLETVK